jgi:hypothetical protein
MLIKNIKLDFLDAQVIMKKELILIIVKNILFMITTGIV